MPHGAPTIIGHQLIAWSISRVLSYAGVMRMPAACSSISSSMSAHLLILMPTSILLSYMS